MRRVPLASLCCLLIVANSGAVAQPRSPAPNGRTRLDVNNTINSILNQVITPNDQYGNVRQGVTSPILITEDQPTNLEAARAAGPDAVRQVLQDLAARPRGATPIDVSSMTDDEFQQYLAIRRANAGITDTGGGSSSADVSRLIDDDPESDPNWNNASALQSDVASMQALLQSLPTGAELAATMDPTTGSIESVGLLPIYAGYVVVPSATAMSSLDLQALTPSSLMIAPSTQVTGMPSAVMTSPDLQPALCGR